jgi:hypothetical protein
MTRKILSAAVILIVVLAAVLHFKHTVPVTNWTAYDGTLARLDFPAGWKVDEQSDEKARYIGLETKTGNDEFLTFSLTEFLPRSGKTDEERLVKDMIQGSPKPHPIVVKHTSFNKLPAQEFTTYRPAPFTHNYNAAGTDVIHVSYTEERNIFFVRSNGRVCEIFYRLPEKEQADYEEIFKKIVESIQLK